MPRLLALDYGGKRTGIAVSDPLQIIANGLTTVPTKELIVFLKKYFEEEEVELVLIGLPMDLQNRDTDATQLVRNFIVKFAETFPDHKMKTLDERFTSKMARSAILESGVNKKTRRNKELVDEVSATILLQGYMSNTNFEL
jgi:putative holliday junction resolvase